VASHDFAGSSTKLSEGIPTTTRLLGATARFQRDYNGKQPGDPKKAAQADRATDAGTETSIATVARQRCVQRGGKKNDLARLEEAIWKELSLSTDFESKPPHLERPK